MGDLVTCPDCPAQRFSWDGGSHKCLTADNTSVKFGHQWLHLTSEVVDWMAA